MTKAEAKKHEWILETQMFQRIAKLPESSYETLEKDYERMVTNRKTS